MSNKPQCPVSTRVPLHSRKDDLQTRTKLCEKAADSTERLRSATALAVLSLVTEKTREQYAAVTLNKARANQASYFDFLRARLYLQAIPGNTKDEQGATAW